MEIVQAFLVVDPALVVVLVVVPALEAVQALVVVLAFRSFLVVASEVDLVVDLA